MDDFNFYLRLAKPLVLDLPDARDRAIAALWLKKLREVYGSTPADDLHVEYLKLLLLAMQENELTGVFEHPPPDGDLHELVPGVKKAQEILHLTRTQKSMSTAEKSRIPANPRVVTSIGGDMCEYVAIQEIPNFGIQGYYGLSTETISKWSNSRPAAPLDDKISSQDPTAATHTGVKKTKAPKKQGKRNLTMRNNDENRIDTTTGATVGSTIAEASSERHERTKHSEKSLRKIFQAQRSEIAGVETRPCWGRSRYIDRLIDESPHVVGDLDLSEADALLHLYRDTKFRRKEKTGAQKDSKRACAISSRRRRVETRLDMPPCASVPHDFDYSQYEKLEERTESRTCCPPDLDAPIVVDEDDDLCDELEDDYSPAVHFAPPDMREYSTLPDDYYPDDTCESQLAETTDYDSWQQYAYEPSHYPNDTPATLFDTDDTPMMQVDSDAISDMRRLVADPYRREPPSRGRIKVPRRKTQMPSAPAHTEGTNIHMDTWDPPGHSTRIHH